MTVYRLFCRRKRERVQLIYDSREFVKVPMRSRDRVVEGSRHATHVTPGERILWEGNQWRVKATRAEIWPDGPSFLRWLENAPPIGFLNTRPNQVLPEPIAADEFLGAGI